MPPTSAPPGLPTFDKLLIPTVHAMRALGGSATVGELDNKLLEILSLPEKVTSYRRESAGRIEVLYRAAWARTYLKQDGVLESTSRAVWALTARGIKITDADLKALPNRVRKAPSISKAGVADEENPEPEIASSLLWRNELLNTLRSLSPASFERLCQRVLRESGFIKVEVTGKTGDGGIDGVGVLRVQLISFQVLFQCKRYRDTVGASAIRDFRGAMVGRTDKGLFITTGRFTPDAQREATRDGAPPIELIDGEAFCDLLLSLRIGTKVIVVEQVVVLPDVLSAI